MSDVDKAAAREEAKEVQQEITKAWKAIAAQYPYVIEDYKKYASGLASWYRHCAEEQEMGGVTIDDHKISQLLQQARTCDIVMTYITSRIDQDVAQSKN